MDRPHELIRRRPAIRHVLSGLNVDPDAIPSDLEAFSLSAAPLTDLWRKPPEADTNTAPILYTSLRYPFTSAEVSISGDWKLEWDSAGLIVFAGPPTGEQPRIPPPPPPAEQVQQQPQDDDQPPPYTPAVAPTKWVKVGYEYSNGTAHVSSTVAGTDGADWSLTALPRYQNQRDDLRVKMNRLGNTLWLYYLDQETGWRKMREITGFFWGVDDKVVRVGVYASRPASFATNPVPIAERAEALSLTLNVQFDDLLIF